jgi:3D (Asp-Asp-Asp) domain-containing protein
MGFFILSGTTSGVTAQAGWMAASQAAPVTAPAYVVTMTGYNAVPGQTDGDPLTTASGAYSNPDIVVARSVDLADELPFGTVIEIDSASTTSDCGYSSVKDHMGLRVVADEMNPRMRNKIDVLFGVDDNVQQGGKMRNAANAIGFCRGTHIHVVGHIDIAHMPKTQAQLAALLGRATFAVAK